MSSGRRGAKGDWGGTGLEGWWCGLSGGGSVGNLETREEGGIDT
jgi:hypothetical protein